MRMAKMAVRAMCALALTFALPVMAWAGNGEGPDKTLAVSDLDADGCVVAVADWPSEQDGKKSLSSAVEIALDADVQGLADAGELVYNFQMSASCDECRTFDWDASIIFKDASGKELGDWSDDGSDYSTYRQSHTLGDSGLVPAGTVTIVVSSSCSVGTKSDLTLDSDIVFTTTANVDPSANGNSFKGTVVGADFYETEDDITSVPSQTFYFDYLKDDSCYADDVDMVATIYLDAEAKEMVAQNLLSYTASVTSACGECRTMHNDISVRCFDASNNEITAGQWVVSEVDYETYPQEKTYQSGTIFIPEGTAYLMLDASNEMTSTNSHLKLWGSLTVSSIKGSAAWDDNVDEEGNPLVTPSFSVKNAVDGYTLSFTDMFNGYSKRVNADDASTLFRSAIYNQGVLFNWAQFAYDVIKTEGAYWDHSEEGFDTAFGSGHYTDLVYQFTHQTDGSVSEGPKDSNAWASSSGLQSASSLSQAIDASFAELAAQRKKMSSRSFGKATEGDFADCHDVQGVLDSRYGTDVYNLTATEGPVFYSAVTTTDQRGAEQVYYYNSFALIFYDFELASVIDDSTYEMTPTESSAPTNTVFQSVMNDTGSSSTLTSNFSHSDSSAATNTITSTTSSSMSQTYGMEGSITAKFGITEGLGIDAGFKASGSWGLTDAFSFSNSQSVSETVQSTSGSGTSTAVPPYSVGIETATTSAVKVSQEYDCPITVRYKVMLISLDGKYYDDGAGVKDFFDYTHDTMAVAVGYNETIDGGAVNSVSAQDALRTNFDSVKIDKSAIQALGVPTTKYCSEDANLKTGTDLLNYLATNLPATYEDAVYVDTATSADYVVNVYPTRPLAFTSVTAVNSKVLKNENTLYLSENSQYDLTNNISVGGFVSATDSSGKSAPYTGFSMANGGWKVYAEDGSAVDASIAEVVTNQVSGHTLLKLGDIDKTTNLMLVYHIKDGVYSYLSSPTQEYGANGYVSDSQLSARASLNLIVSQVEGAAGDNVIANENTAQTQDSDDTATEVSGELESSDDDSSVVDDQQSTEATNESNADNDQSASAEDEQAASSEDEQVIEPSSAAGTSAAFLDVSKRLKTAWSVFVATYGVVDLEEELTETQLIDLLYAASCIAKRELPQADPRNEDEREAYSAEAVVWAEEQGFYEKYQGKVFTYREAFDLILDTVMEKTSQL